jgi:HEAT repeat protein
MPPLRRLTAAAPPLLVALDSRDSVKRGHAAYLLGFTGEPKVIPALAALLVDESEVGLAWWLPTVSAGAAMALKHIGTREALRALEESDYQSASGPGEMGNGS